MTTHFGERLKALARALGKDDQDVAQDLGLSKAQMSHYTTGKRKVPSDLLQNIVDTYGINPQFLFDKNAPLYVNKYDDLNNVSKEPSVIYMTNNYSEYPYFPIGVSAGLPVNVDPIDNAERIKIPDEVLGKYARSKNIFFMRVNGESMNKVIPHGSLIAVKQVTISELKNGDIVVYSNDYEYAVKRFYDFGDKVVFKPESTDPHFTDKTYDKTNEELRIHGKVVTYIVNLQ